MNGSYKLRLKACCLALLASGFVTSIQKSRALSSQDNDCQVPTSSEQLKVIDVENLTECFEPETLSLLHDSLMDDDWQVQVVAAYSLGEIDLSGIEAQIVSDLTKLSAHEDSRVRYTAITALGKINPEEVASTLLESLSDTDENVRASAVVALIQSAPALQTSDLEILKFELKKAVGTTWSEETDEKNAAIDDVRIDLYSTILIRALGYKDWRVREAAKEALTQLFIEDERVLKAWAGYNNTDNYEGVRYVVQGLLYDIFFEVSKERDITDTFISSGSPNAIKVLGILKERRAIPALLKVVENSDDTSIGRPYEAASFSLGLMDVTEAAPIFTEKLKGLLPAGELVNAYNLTPLWQADTTESIPLLAEVLNERKDDFGKLDYGQAAIALAYFGTEESVAELLNALKSEDYSIQRAAVSAFSFVSRQDSTEVLRDARVQAFPILLDIARRINSGEIEEDVELAERWYDHNIQDYADPSIRQIRTELILLSEDVVAALENMGEDFFPEIVHELPPETELPIFVSTRHGSYMEGHTGLKRYYFEAAGQTIDFNRFFDSLFNLPKDAFVLLENDVFDFVSSARSQNAVNALSNSIRLLEEGDYPDYLRGEYINFLEEELTRASAALQKDNEAIAAAEAEDLIHHILSGVEYSNGVRTALADYNAHLKWNAIADVAERQINNSQVTEAIAQVALYKANHPELRRLAKLTLEQIGIETAALGLEDDLNEIERRECFPLYNEHQRKLMSEYDYHFQTCRPLGETGRDYYESIVRALKGLVDSMRR